MKTQKTNLNKLLSAFLVAISILIIFACEKTPPPPPSPPTNLAENLIIPLPNSVNATGKSFKIEESTKILLKSNAVDLESVGGYLSDKIASIAGFDLKTEAITGDIPDDHILLEIAANANVADAGYEININEKNLIIKAKNPEGLFYGIQTVIQLLPLEINQGASEPVSLNIPTGTINDSPNFAFRGAMLDVSRHFFTVDEVKQFIDYMAMYKMNVFHMHLSDDQGWRIEIKSWPNLTAHGGSTEVGGGEGGFYTQEEYKEIVKYAADRFITVIPEIDLPGHTNAALASYAELNCDGKATKLYTGTEVGFSTLCAEKAITYQFIDDVVGELAAMTPGPYIHIGGDESHATAKNDYIRIIDSTQQIVARHQKIMIGWEEIVQSNLTSESLVQFWSDTEHAKHAAEKGLTLIMSPSKRVYLDMQYDSTSIYGLHWAAYIEVDEAYNWEPTTLIEGIGSDQILGIEAPLWSETISDINEADYLIFPRLQAIAEVAWTPSSQRNWDKFKYRLAEHGKRMDHLGIKYYKSDRVPWDTENSNQQ